MTAGAELAAVDVAIVAAYFIAVLAHGLWVGRGERDALDYFLAGRTGGWFGGGAPARPPPPETPGPARRKPR